MNHRRELFHLEELHIAYRVQIKDAVNGASGFVPEFAQGKSEAEIVNYFISEKLLDQIIVNRGNRETCSDDITRGGQHSIVIDWPFTGPPEVLSMKPRTPANIMPLEGFVIGNVIRRAFVAPTFDEIKQEMDSWLVRVEEIVANLNADAEFCNQEIREACTAAVKLRLVKISEHMAGLEYLGLKKRAHPPEAVNMPMKRRPAVAEIRQPANSGNAQSERLLVVPDSEYQNILRILHSMARAFEYSPDTFSRLKEEDIRNILLVALNGHYEGQAGGETFNGSGKTDILIRHQNANVFVAECKMWTGAVALSDAIDQLLGYVTWRDTKTALIVFNKNRDFDGVLSRIDTAVMEHPHHIAKLNTANETQTTYKFRNANHPDKELDLTVLAFDTTQH